jgi:uracil-DNA glycosylase
VIGPIPSDWAGAIGDHASVLLALNGFRAEQERSGAVIYPPAGMELEALRLTSLRNVRAVILGQDPYHKTGQAHGLAFSVPPGVARPPTLRNILTELGRDPTCKVPPGGSLVPWAEHGVLLLNTTLTVGVRDGKVESHEGYGWEQLTDEIVSAIAARPGPVVFLLWGAHAIQKRVLIKDHPQHIVIESSHPSPLSANRRCGDARPFVGSSPFIAANAALASLSQPALDWHLA